jgi:hypothetical protein
MGSDGLRRELVECDFSAAADGCMPDIEGGFASLENK